MFLPHKLNLRKLTWMLPFVSIGLGGCASHDPMPTVDRVDLERFMGTWYVQVYSPLWVDRDAVNPIEHYYLSEDGSIATTYQFRRGSVEARLRTYTPTGTVYNEDANSEWRMQFLWPFKAEYLIVGLDEDYGGTVIGHPNRKYAWIMHREPDADPERLQRHKDLLTELGFDVDALETARHDWDAEPERKAYLQSLVRGQPYTFR